MIIAIDFDGTCVTHDYPKIGRDIGAVPILKKLVERGHQLILWTCRCDAHLMDAKDWFDKNGIELYGINANPTQKEWSDSPKAHAHLCIDDVALGVPLITDGHKRPYVHWGKVHVMLEKHGLL